MKLYIVCLVLAAAGFAAMLYKPAHGALLMLPTYSEEADGWLRMTLPEVPSVKPPALVRKVA